ncbi:MAG: C39 family peptidase [Verrucomicrobia bacterium]|nr:C39 family peptidase [Verrucomicrobiota bacterium]
MTRPSLITLAIAATLSCASPGGAAAGPYASVRIEAVPHVQQKPDFCGEACVSMALAAAGVNMDQDAVFDRAGLDPMLARGCYTRELLHAVTSIGFVPGTVSHRVQPKKSKAQLNRLFGDMHGDLKRGIPSIICTRYSEKPHTTEHFRLILGFDGDTDEVIYHEPAVANGAYQRMSRKAMLSLWPLKYRDDEWTVIRIPLKPGSALSRGRVPQSAAPASRFSDAAYAQHVMGLRKRLPGPEFHITFARPFVVIGDEDRETVERRARKTIEWATKRLKQDYFPKDPNHIIDIWLFKDKPSYEKHTLQLFKERPTTPFGYYSDKHRALIMNIATGGGTLVHEMVHPFMEANFPACPAWFNEGLASLYEQCGEKDGHIYGYTNWRLAGLQLAMRGGKVPSFKELCGTSTVAFYTRDPGSNYAQARYLCYNLQEKGLLRKYYHAFRRASADDPGGYDTLVQILDAPDMSAFQTAWQAYVLKLRFPARG